MSVPSGMRAGPGRDAGGDVGVRLGPPDGVKSEVHAHCTMTEV